MENPAPAPRLRGEVVYLFAFDVANEIRLDRAAEILEGKAGPVEPAGERPAPRPLPGARPLTVELTAPPLRVNGEPARLVVRLYDVGVVSVTVRVGFERESLAALAPFHAPAADGGRTLADHVRERCSELRRRLEPALVRPGTTTEPEAYTVFCLADLGGERDAGRWLGRHERAVAGLLSETHGELLSEGQVADVLRLRRSFLATDLVVIDWDNALVVGLDGPVDDVLQVLELANLQLEEFRWMDASLDRYLERAYDDLARRRWWAFGGAARVIRSLRSLRVDLARLADEVTHITKFVGDWHAARVYLLARERFHLEQWRASVEQRLGELDRLYTMLRGDVYDRRMLVLELLIVIFFAIDLLFLFTRK